MEDQIINFKVRKKEYELFFAEDGGVEMYEKDNPKEGLIFNDYKSFLNFINTLTDVIEKREMENEIK